MFNLFGRFSEKNFLQNRIVKQEKTERFSYLTYYSHPTSLFYKQTLGLRIEANYIYIRTLLICESSKVRIKGPTNPILPTGRASEPTFVRVALAPNLYSCYTCIYKKIFFRFSSMLKTLNTKIQGFSTARFS
jgi:hypothetical protein